MQLTRTSALIVCLGLLIGSSLLYPTASEADSDTPLMEAIKDGRFQDAIQLIDAGADVNVIVESGPHSVHSALGLTLKQNVPPVPIEVLEKLIKAGADVNGYIEPGDPYFIFNVIIRNKWGAAWQNLVARNHTLLSFAIGTKKPIEVIKLLIDSGADVNKLDLHRQGVTPLMIAQVIGYDEVIPLLKKAGASEVSLPSPSLLDLVVEMISQALDYIKSFFAC